MVKEGKRGKNGLAGECFIYDTVVLGSGLIKRDGWGWESRDNIGIWGVGEHDLEFALHRCGIWKQG